MASIFISYRRDDTAGEAGRLQDRLVSKFGRDRVFMDIVTIEPGLDFVEAIEEHVSTCSVLLLVIGRRWLLANVGGVRRIDDPADFHRLEIEVALKRNIRIIPVLVQGALMLTEADLPEALKGLARRHAQELSASRWDYDVGRLFEVITKIVSPDQKQSENFPEKTTDRPSERSDAPVSDYVLRIVETEVGRNVGKTFSLDESVTIGRDSRCAIVLDEVSVSRHHARLELTSKGIKLTDLGSGNGVWVGSRRVTDFMLHEGLQFRIGSTVLVCETETHVSAPFSGDADRTVLLSKTTEPDSTVEGALRGVLLRIRKCEADVVDEIIVPGPTVVVGRAPECDVVVDNPEVSRRHVKIQGTSEGFRVTDLGGLAGLWINNTQVEEVLLQPGQTFGLGLGHVVECYWGDVSGSSRTESGRVRRGVRL